MPAARVDICAMAWWIPIGGTQVAFLPSGGVGRRFSAPTRRKTSVWAAWLPYSPIIQPLRGIHEQSRRPAAPIYGVGEYIWFLLALERCSNCCFVASMRLETSTTEIFCTHAAKNLRVRPWRLQISAGPARAAITPKPPGADGLRPVVSFAHCRDLPLQQSRMQPPQGAASQHRQPHAPGHPVFLYYCPVVCVHQSHFHVELPDVIPDTVDHPAGPRALAAVQHFHYMPGRRAEHFCSLPRAQHRWPVGPAKVKAEKHPASVPVYF